MSKRNEAVNRIAQGTQLYASLNQYKRVVFMAALKAAFAAGRAEGEATK